MFGLVPSLNRPAGNLTGVSILNTYVIGKRLQLLHELVPAATLIAFLANPTIPFLQVPRPRSFRTPPAYSVLNC